MLQCKSPLIGQKMELGNAVETKRGSDIVWRWWWAEDWRKQRSTASRHKVSFVSDRDK